MQNKYVYIGNEVDYKLKNLSNLQKPCKTIRSLTRNSEEDVDREHGPGVYELNQFDIKARLKKKLKHYEKL